MFGGAIGVFLCLVIVFLYSQFGPMIRGLVAMEAQENAARYAAGIDARVSELLATARILASVSISIEADRPELRRGAISSILRASLERNPDYMAA
jgi:hypothetical protein